MRKNFKDITNRSVAVSTFTKSVSKQSQAKSIFPENLKRQINITQSQIEYSEQDVEIKEQAMPGMKSLDFAIDDEAMLRAQSCKI